MANEAIYSGEQINGFVGLLKNDLPDPRDNRGKRHSLAFVIVGFVLATLVGRQKLWVRLFSAKLSRLSRSQFEIIILRYRGIVTLALLAAVKGDIVLKIAAGAKGA
jgi:hypothetical protein